MPFAVRWRSLWAASVVAVVSLSLLSIGTAPAQSNAHQADAASEDSDPGNVDDLLDASGVDKFIDVPDSTIHAGESCTEGSTSSEQGQEPVKICVEFGDFGYADIALDSAQPNSSGMLPLPEWCTNDPNINGWRYNRADSCGIAEGLYTITNVNTGAVIGLLPFMRYALLYTVPGDVGWGFQIEISPLTGLTTGVAKGSSVQGNADCFGDCTVVEETFPSQLVNDTNPPLDAQGESYHESDPDPAETIEVNSRWSYWFSTPSLGRSTAIRVNPYNAIRCDDALPGGERGCVLPEYTPVYIESLSGGAPAYVQHLQAALDSGLPGAYGDTPLTRLTSAALRRRNGDTACPQESSGGYPRPTGYECDEYPFRSTLQGAYTGRPDPQTPTPGRTFDWCQISALGTGSGSVGWSACMIPGTQNSAGGTSLNEFYKDNRVLGGDNFYVYIVS